MNGTTTRQASFKQLKWLRDLLIQHDYSNFPADWRDYCDFLKEAFDRCTQAGYEAGDLNNWLSIHFRDREVSQDTFKTLLPRLQSAPKSKAPAAQREYPDASLLVPAGRYAIPTEDGARNKLAFYLVNRPEEGKWAGKVFVSMLVSDNGYRLPFATQAAVLRKIAAFGAESASAAYGREIGECGVCGRTLTNDESRARGIGPVCDAKMGW